MAWASTGIAVRLCAVALTLVAIMQATLTWAQDAPIPGGLTQSPGIYALGPSLAANGGFESNDGTKPTVWRTDAAWTIDATGPHAEAVSLRLTDAPSVPFAQIAYQPIQLRAGIYKLSGWIKTESLGANTAGSGVRLMLDYGQNGVLQRSVTPVVSGTRGWTYFERPNIVVPSDRLAYLKLEAYREPSGTAWFDDIRLEEQLPAPIEVFVLYPNYRGMLFEDQPSKMRFDINVAPPGGNLTGYTVQTRLREEGSGTIVAQRSDPAAAHFVAELDGTAMAFGRAYLVEVGLLDGGGGTVYTAPAYRVSRVSAATKATMNVAFDERNRILMRGIPRFVLGVYDSGSGYSTSDAFWESLLWSPTGDRRMDGLSINTYLNYWYGQAPADAMTALMTNLQRRGVTYLQTGNCFQGSPASASGFQIDTSDAYVQTIGAHPGSAGYYTVDECDSLLLPEVHGQYLRLGRLDPDSVTLAALLGNPPEVFLWSDSVDILSTDPYPLAGAEPTGGYPHNLVADWTTITRQAVMDARPFMTVLQFFKLTSLGRWPTPAEMRSHATMAIVEGARGLFWWSLGASALRDVCSGWCDEKTQHMNDLKTVVGQFAGLEAALLADDSPESLPGNSNPSAIRTKVKIVDSRGYLFAYNNTATSASATFTWSAPILSVAVDGEGRTLTPTGTSFTDTFNPYEAHIYVVQQALPLTVRFAAPTDGQIVSGPVTLTAEAGGGTIQAYTFTVDGQTVQSGPSANAVWDSRTVSNGLHTLTVTATDSLGRSAQQAIRVTVANGAAPSAPSSLTAKAVARGRLDLAWIDTASNEDGFAIERATDGKTFQEIARVGRDVTTATDTGLADNTFYYYRVRAFNGAGASVYSNTVKVKTRPK